MSGYSTNETVKSIVQAKAEQDQRDFETILKKRDSNKTSFSIKDIVDCNRLPLLKTRISTPATASKAYSMYAFCRDWGMGDEENGKLNTNSMSQLGSTELKSSLGGAYRGLSIKQEVSRVIQTTADMENENDKLTRVLQYMTDAKQIIDSSRLYFEAAVNFQEMEMFERASYCYKKATKRASAALVVDTYDLPEDEKFRRHVERMSKFQLPKFMETRGALRHQLIFAEEERQRLRARESHYQLVRIHLLTDLVDLALAHTNLRLAFKCCANAAEHKDMLLSMHVLLKEFASMKRKEIPLVKQIERGTQGPIADAHLHILLELEALFPVNADVHEWLGYRYTEKCEFDAAQFHFKKLRDILDPLPDMQDTLLVWGSSFKINVTSADDPIQVAIENQIKANICKTPISRISLEGQVPGAVLSETDKAIADMAAKLQERRDRHRGAAAGASAVGVGESSMQDSGSGGIAFNSTAPSSAEQHSAGSRRPSVPPLGSSVGSGQQGAYSQPRLPPQQNQPTQHSQLVPQGELSGQPNHRDKDAQKDYAWFGGVHTDCNTIIYKAPLQGWNTLLPSSFAGSAPASAPAPKGQGKMRPPSTLVNKKF